MSAETSLLRWVWLRRGLLAFWTLAIWLGSLWPLTGPVAPGGDKLQHFAGYGVLALLAMWNAGRPLPVWLCCTLMGVVIEFLQGLSGYRAFELADMVANGAGALAGVLLMQSASRLRRR